MAFPWAAAASLAGDALGFLGSSSANASANANAQAQLQLQREIAERNFKFQLDAAQQGIRWKVADAQAAGIHPIYALGAPTFSPSPVSISGVDIPRDDSHQYLRSMGQNLGRAIAATQTEEERKFSAYEMIRQQQELEKGSLENDLIRSQIRRNDAATGPSFPAIRGASPMASQGDVRKYGAFDPTAPEVNNSVPGAAYITAGPGHPSADMIRMPDGGYMPAPAKPLNIDEATSPGWLTWMWQHKILPFFDNKTGAPPRHLLPEGAYKWTYHLGTWKPVYHADYINRSRGQKPMSHLPERSEMEKRGWYQRPAPYHNYR